MFHALMIAAACAGVFVFPPRTEHQGAWPLVLARREKGRPTQLEDALTMLHIVPGDSAAGSLRHALKKVGREDEVVALRDDLSCGPIASMEPAERADWWAQFYDWSESEALVRTFWERVENTDERLVVWYGRQSARELAFLLAWSDRLEQRHYDVVDVTGRRLRFIQHDGAIKVTEPITNVATVPTAALLSLLGEEKPVDSREREIAARTWRILKKENASFRVVTSEGLVSAPIDHFDLLLLEQVSRDWRKINSVISSAIGQSWTPYVQQGDMMLHARIVALIEAGKLEADDDPWNMLACLIRLPKHTL